jgi:hypothetical protein
MTSPYRSAPYIDCPLPATADSYTQTVQAYDPATATASAMRDVAATAIGCGPGRAPEPTIRG